MREPFVPGWRCVWEVVGNRAQRGRFRLFAAVCLARCHGAKGGAGVGQREETSLYRVTQLLEQ